MRYNGRLLGTPETRRKGRSTLKALRAFMSNPPPFSSGTPAILLMVSKAKVKRLQETSPRHTARCLWWMCYG